MVVRKVGISLLKSHMLWSNSSNQRELEISEYTTLEALKLFPMLSTNNILNLWHFLSRVHLFIMTSDGEFGVSLLGCYCSWDNSKVAKVTGVFRLLQLLFVRFVFSSKSPSIMLQNI